MQWLEGPELGALLRRGPMPLASVRRLALRLLSGLEFVHARGIVHRDIKPSNVVVCGEDPDRAMLVDFGTASGALRRRMSLERGAAVEGALLGTVGYMAPEQARGLEEVDARADLFGLGCLLYEGVTGKPAFWCEQPVVSLARVLLEEPLAPSQLCPGIPRALEALILALLSKAPADRPASAREVREALLGLELPSHPSPACRDAGPARITAREQRALTLMLLHPMPSLEPNAEGMAALRALGERFGAHLEPLEGSSAMMLFATEPGVDALRTAERAARVAFLAPAQGWRAEAIATGLGEMRPEWPSDPLAARLDRLSDGGGARDAEALPPIRLDPSTARFLYARIPLGRDAAGAILEPNVEPDRLGPSADLGGALEASAIVGREAELRLLERAWEEVVEDSVRRIVLLIGAAGIGKSRLARELVSGAREGGSARIVILRADPERGSDALSLRLVETLLADSPQDERLSASAAPPASSASLEARLGRRLAPEAARRCARAFSRLLSDSLDAPDALASPERPGGAGGRAELLYGRRMAELSEALGIWLEALAREAPLLLVLEDLHGADEASLMLLELLLARTEGLPSLWIASARPELLEERPGIWRSVQPQLLSLRPLRRKAAESLVRAHVPALEPELVSRIVARAAGNPFYLEELARHAELLREEGLPEEGLPETVVVMLERRLRALAPQTRRVMRAASVFGLTFRPQGVEELVGLDADEVASRLEQLLEARLLVRVPSASPPGRAPLSFRHELHRDAAYATLTPGDRRIAHGLAAEWLLASGERDARAIAEHHARSAEPVAAAPYFRVAAERAFRSGSVRLTGSLARRGLECGAAGELRGLLRLLEGEALGWGGRASDLLEPMAEATELLPAGSTPWLVGLSGALHAEVFSLRMRGVAELWRDLGARAGTMPASARVAMSVYRLVSAAAMAGEPEALHLALRHLEDPEGDDAAYRLYRASARSLAASSGFLDRQLAIPEAERALGLAEGQGDRLGRSLGLFLLALAELDADLPRPAAEHAAACIPEAEAAGAQILVHGAVYLRACAQLGLGERGVAEALSQVVERADPLFANLARAMRALARLKGKDPDAAKRDAAGAREALVLVPQGHAIACFVETIVSFARGDSEGALSCARSGFQSFSRGQGMRHTGEMLAQIVASAG
ncbi:MAG: AAA family ATPase [Myxococcales bacterium]|nr:AAA family ATPase [Myxococcales bacterium]